MHVILRLAILLAVATMTCERPLWGDPPQVLFSQRYHLRCGDQREWATFPLEAQGSRLELTFEAKKNEQEQTLLIRHRDVRQVWDVIVNGGRIGKLEQDENAMIGVWALPPGTLHDGENRLEIASKSKTADDIEVGPVRLFDRRINEALNEARVEVAVTDRTTREPIPCRLTIVDESNALAPLGAESGGQLAVRTGVVYSGTGRATFGLPAGRYRIFAGRGFEYSLEQEQIDARAGEPIRVALSIGRDIATPGLVACDTHVHTVTYSGHGDATIGERMITLAGEGIELPIATDHNTHTNYEPAARQAGMRQYFTPVIGNEVTTRRGHFNIFPVDPIAAVPDYGVTDWSLLIPALFETPNVQVVILNHGRDTHAGFRPFGPETFNEAVGWNFVGDEIGFNTMEVINSAAPQTDQFELFRDWMSLLNRGYRITPIGSSDSHDVNRYIVGQGRTYVKCDDSDPARINVADACRSLREGRVRLSCGLFVDLKVVHADSDEQHGPGDLVEIDDSTQIDVRVLCPAWARASDVALFSNGVKTRAEKLDGFKPTEKGIDAIVRWSIDRPKHDVFITALAWGPRVESPAWLIAKPYQSDGPDWTANVIGLTGATWIDADGDGKFTSAFEYASREIKAAGGDLTKLVERLAGFDESVAAQAASLLHAAGIDLEESSNRRIWQGGAQHVRRGIEQYLRGWEKCRRAGAKLERPLVN